MTKTAAVHEAAPDDLTIERLAGMRQGLSDFPEVREAMARVAAVREAEAALVPLPRTLDEAAREPLHVRVIRSERREAATRDREAADAALKAAREAAFARVREVVVAAHVREAVAAREALERCIDALGPIARLEELANGFLLSASSYAPARHPVTDPFGAELRARLRRVLDQPRFRVQGAA